MTASTWEDRMAARAADRARELAEANEREDMTLIGADHLHGTATACPCGAETGITCVVFEDGRVQPDPCETCGKPVSRFCDGQPHREVPKHAIGCPEHPESTRCASCGRVPWTGMMSSGQRWYCMDCTAQAPGVTPLDLSRATRLPPVAAIF